MIRILAVDDEKPIVELLKLTLNRSGYQCIGAYDGIQAANLIEKEAFDVLMIRSAFARIPCQNAYFL